MQLTQALSEICKLSALKATTALSRFLHVPVGVEMKAIEIKTLGDLNTLMDRNEKVISLFQLIKGDVSGGSFMLYQQASALNICDILFHHKEGETKTITEAEESALAEVANIVVGNFLTAFAQSLNLSSLMHQSAIFNSGTYGSICNSVLPTLTQKLEHEFIVLISLDFNHITITEYALFILEEEKINEIVKQHASINGY